MRPWTSRAVARRINDQQRGNEKIGQQGVQRHGTEMEQLQRQHPEQSRNRDGQRCCEALAAIRQPRLNSLLETRCRQDQPSGGRRTELKPIDRDQAGRNSNMPLSVNNNTPTGRL